MSSQRMIVSRRVALAAAALVLGLSSCGDPNTPTAGRPPVIQLMTGARATGAAPQADTSRAFMPYGDVTYVYSGSFPQLATTAGSWYFPTGATPNLDRIAAMARTLGVTGDVRQQTADQGGGWMVGAADYTTSSLYVTADAMLTWWYNPDPSTWQQGTVSCAIADAPTGAATDAPTPPDAGGTAVVASPEPVPVPCPEPTPPAGVPSGDAALASAKSLAADLGYEPTAFEWEVYADQWSASVNGTMLLDGQRIPVSFSVGFGAQGAISWAGGSLATPQRGAEYPLVGPQAGLDRLNDQSGVWFGLGVDPASISSRSVGVATSGSGVAAAGSVVDAVPVNPGGPDVTPPTDVPPSGTLPVDTVVPETVPGGTVPIAPPVDPSLPVDTVVVDPMPIEPCDTLGNCPAPQPITITFTSVKLDATMVWAADGTVWVLPAYTFSAADGGTYTVIAVDDSFIQLPEPAPVPEPLPLPVPVPLPPDTPVSEPAG
jgi:hypothetical protein